MQIVSFPENKIWHFIQIFSKGNRIWYFMLTVSKEMSNPIFWRKKIRYLFQNVSCWIFSQDTEH